MAVVLTIANNKGGVGKTQVACQLAAALARLGFRVLCIDMDPQGNMTRRLGVELDPSDPILTTSEIIKADSVGAGEQAVIGCGWEAEDGVPTKEAELIDLIPGRFDLVNRESESGVLGAVRRLRKALEGWSAEYDFVLIDTPPSLGHLTQMALAASDHVITPTEPSFDGIEAAIRIRDFVTQHAADLANPGLQFSGVFVTKKKANSAEQDFQVEGLIERFGDQVWNLAGPIAVDGEEVVTQKWIPDWTRFNEADASGVSLTAWAGKRAREHVAVYDQLAKQLVKRLDVKVAA